MRGCINCEPYLTQKHMNVNTLLNRLTVSTENNIRSHCHNSWLHRYFS